MPRAAIPFVPDRFDSRPHTLRMSELLRLGGQQSADYELRKGDIAANLGTNLASTLGQAASGIANYVAEGPQRSASAAALQERADQRARETAIRDVTRKVPPEEATGRPDLKAIAEQVQMIDPIAALDFWKAADQQTQAQMAQAKQQVETIAKLMAEFEGSTRKLDPVARQAAYTQMRDEAIGAGVMGPEDAPERYSPAFISRTIAQIRPVADLFKRMEGEAQKQGFTLTVGDKSSRFEPNAEGGFSEVASLTETPKPAATPSTIQAAIVAAQTRGDQPEVQRLLALQKQYEAAGRAPNAPVNPLEQEERRLRVEMLRTQLEKAQNPQVATDEKVSAMVPVFEEIKRLSDKIFTSEGVTANFVGAGRTAMASANWDEDVKLYNALIEGMTPMVARAVGHTGVLTQQDVDSTKKLFGRIGVFGTDSKGIASSKIDTFARLMSGNGAEAEKAEIRRVMGWDDGPSARPGAVANPFRRP